MNRNRRPKSRRFRQKHFLSCIIILRYGFFLLGRRRVSSALIAAVTTALVTAALAAVPAFIAAVRIVASAIASFVRRSFRILFIRRFYRILRLQRFVRTDRIFFRIRIVHVAVVFRNFLGFIAISRVGYGFCMGTSFSRSSRLPVPPCVPLM